MESRMVKFYSKESNMVAIHAIPGHFATSHSHINYYIDITSLKTRIQEAKEVARVLHQKIGRVSYVDTIVCMDGTEVIGAFLAEEFEKEDIRAMAASYGLSSAEAPDSQEICFIPDGDYAAFIAARGLADTPGHFFGPAGEDLGPHRGVSHYTVGQRKGLGIGSPAPDGRPRYVLETRPETNQVVVGASELLSISRITATDAVWLARDDDGSEATNLFVQLRAHGTPIPVASLTRDWDAGTISVVLEGSARGVARGQSMVVYRGSRVLGEGTINATAR